MGQTLRDRINDYRKEKEERYLQYEALLGEALEAGKQAAEAAEAARQPGRSPRRGAVRVRLADGRSSFARFVRQAHPDEWKYGTRRAGTYFPVPHADYDKALRFAFAMHEVLSRGEVGVAVDAQHVPASGD